MMYCKRLLVLSMLFLMIIPVCSKTKESNVYLHQNFNKKRELIDNELKHIKELLENGETNEALNKLYLVIDKAEVEKNESLIIEGKILLGDILRENGNYFKSTQTYNGVLPLIKSDLKKTQYIYFKKGGNFQLDNQIDSAQVNYDKAVNFEKNIEGNEDMQAKIHANLSGIYYLKANCC